MKTAVDGLLGVEVAVVVVVDDDDRDHYLGKYEKLFDRLAYLQTRNSHYF